MARATSKTAATAEMLSGIDPAALLRHLADQGTPIIAGDEVSFHGGKQIILPEKMTYERAQAVLTRLREEAETITEFSRVFRYRPWDGAYAAARVLKDRYGMVLGESTQTMFGTQPPETVDIAIDVDTHVQVPWGHLSVPTMPKTDVYFGSGRDKDYGLVFSVVFQSPRKNKDEIQEFFNAVEEYLRTSSIYRGKSVVGTNELEFLDVRGFNASEIVFSDQVETQLEGTLFAPLRYSATMRSERLSLKRAVLAYGEYGTGKSSLGLITAQIANANGWTFLSGRMEDDIQDLLRTARMYQPAVVFIEDIDNKTGADSSTQDEVSAFLDAFDGITAKGGEIMVVMTSNHLDRIHKGMLRPGRLDAVIEVAALDRNGVERLIKIICANKVEDDVNYDAVYLAMEGFTPAFVVESLNRAKTFAISRLEGGTDYTLATDDLVNAAISLHAQLDALNSASEGTKMPTVDASLRQMVQAALNNTELVHRGSGEPQGLRLQGDHVDLTTVELPA